MTETRDTTSVRAAHAQARPRQPQAAQARRPRRGLGHGQDVRPRPEGLRLALGRQAARALRGRPDADPHADAQAARPAHEEVDAVRAVPDAHAAGEPRRPRGALRRRATRRHARDAPLARACTKKGVPGQGPRQGRAHQAADRPRARVQRRRPRGHRGRRRHLPVVESAAADVQAMPRAPGDALARPAPGGRGRSREPVTLRGRHAVDDPQRLHGRRDPQEARLHGAAARALPARLAHPGAGHQHPGRQRRSRASSAAAAS